MRTTTRQKLTLTEAFAFYGARLKNPLWAYSAVASDGSFVLSCWEHFLVEQCDGTHRYEDNLSRWARNSLGKNLFIRHLSQALKDKLSVRLIVARAEDPEPIIAGEDASKISKEFFVRDDLTGQVTQFDGDFFQITFKSCKTVESLRKVTLKPRNL
jgi:hypothetical protein